MSSSQPWLVVISSPTDFYTPRGHRLRWFSLSTILDDFARYIITWLALTASQRKPRNLKPHRARASLHKASNCRKAPRPTRPDSEPAGLSSGAALASRMPPLSDNGCSYVSGDLAKLLEEVGMGHVHGISSLPDSGQDRVLAFRRSGTRILLENYHLSGDLKVHMAKLSCFNAKGSNERRSNTDDCNGT